MKRSTPLFRCGGLFAAVAVLAVWPLLGAQPAWAAPVSVVSSVPTDGSVVATSPTSITVTFDQTIGSASSVVITCNGNAVPQPGARTTEDLQSLVVDLSSKPLPRGSCVVGWKVQGLVDAGTSSGTFSFDIQQDTAATTSTLPTAAPGADGTVSTDVVPTPSATPSASSASSNVGGALGLARIAATLALAALFGSLALIAVAWPEGVEYILTIRFLRYAWLAALLGTVVTVACLAAQATGNSFMSSLGPTNWFELAHTTPGKAALARLLLVAASAWVVIRPERCIDPATQLPALAIPGLAVATMGFSRAGGDLELLGYGAGMLHAVAMAVWLGGLLLLARVVLAGPGDDDLVHAVRGFGRMVTPAWITVLATGCFQLYRLDSGHLLGTDHGRLLVLKVIVVAAMVFVGVATRQFIQARLNRADVMSAPMAGKLRRAIGMEAIIGVVVLGITAWMLASPPGNLSASGVSSNKFAYQQRFVDSTKKLDLRLSIDPAAVGRNEMLVEVVKPRSSISQITIRFDPPLNSTARSAVESVALSSAGIAYLPMDPGIQFAVAGAWTVTLDVVSADGTFHQAAVLNVVAGTGATPDIPLTTVTQPVVTSPPGVGTNGATTTTTTNATSTSSG
ncbi:unannotated protein [freshwater metagenome]|uniref:Unannotated protein n=1 Tax=freshwater metagenome TaxID=449393 RepID=A0A6J7CIC2_9ZZZZ|nr:hypothetical protein [Actinomycetota bacterium]